MTKNKRNHTRLGPEVIQERIQSGWKGQPPKPHYSIDFTTYTTTNAKCRIVDAEFGEFWASASEVVRGKKDHPKRLKHDRLTAAEVAAETQRLHPYMTLDESTYKGLTRKARFVDEKFGEYWSAPQWVIKHHLSKHPKRAAYIKALPVEEVQRRLSEGYQDAPPRSYLTIDPATYESVDKKARFIDEEFGEWWAYPNNILKGQGHPKRKGNKVYTVEEVKAAISNRPEITLDESTFKSVTVKARFVDRDFGEFWVKPQSLMRFKGRGHIQRAYKNRKISDDVVFRRLNKIKPHLVLDVATYTDISEPARFVDVKFGDYWVSPRWILYNKVDHPKRAILRSGLEEKVSKLIGMERYGVCPEFFRGTEHSRLKPDFKLTEDIYLEVDGVYWHSEKFIEDKKWHFRRREVFEKYGKRLLQFREDEIRQKPLVVVSMINNARGFTARKVGARQCELTEAVPSSFFKENHLMGFASGTGIGLTYQEQIVAAMSYKVVGKTIKIVRFCTLPGWAVAGAYSKFLKEIVKRSGVKAGVIENWIDLRYGTGRHLYGLGFTKEKITLGWRWTDGSETFNRLRCRANMDARKLSEREHANELKWYRLYDAGQAKFVKAFRL